MAAFSLNSARAVQINSAGTPNDRITVTFLSGNRTASTVYYGADSTVSSTNNLGSLTPGQSLTIDRGTRWFIAGTASDGSLGSASLTADAPHETQFGDLLMREGTSQQLQSSADHGGSYIDVGSNTATATGVPTVFNVKDNAYGAKGDGSTDDTAAVQAAITAALTTGGTVYFPPGIYQISGTGLSMKTFVGGKHTVSLRGSASEKQAPSATGAGASSSLLRFTGTSGNLLKVTGSFGFDISNLAFLQSSGSGFTGDLVTITGESGIDTQYWSVHNCGFGGSTCNSLLLLNQCEVGHIHDNYFNAGGGTRCVQMGGTSNVINNIVLGPSNLFINASESSIFLKANDLERIRITSNTFEIGTTPSSIKGDATVYAGSLGCFGVEIDGNWFADVGAITHRMIDSLRTWSQPNFPSVIRNNFFYSNGSGGTAACCYLKGRWVTSGNTFFADPPYYSDDWTHFTLSQFGDGKTLWVDANRPATYEQYGDQGAIVSLTNQINILSSGGSPTTESVVLGSSGQRPTNVGVKQGYAGYERVNNSANNPGMVLQAPVNANSNGDVALYGNNNVGGAGTGNPELMLQIHNLQMGLFGVPVVSMPNTTGTTTGFTAGAGTGVTDQSTFTGNVSLAVPSLTASAVGSGGTFAAGTYFYQMTALNAAGETTGSTERSVTVVLNGSVNLTWARIPGASSYKIYRSTTTGTENVSPALVTTIASGNTESFTDTGAATSAGAVPGSNTASLAYRISDIVNALKKLGVLAS